MLCIAVTPHRKHPAGSRVLRAASFPGAQHALATDGVSKINSSDPHVCFAGCSRNCVIFLTHDEGEDMTTDTIDRNITHAHVREKEILDFMNRLLTLDNLDEMLNDIVREAPRLIDAKYCIICLSPHLVKSYNGILLDYGDKEIHKSQINGEFIVLAAANTYEDWSEKIGKYFYRLGEGLTGWVSKHKREILLDNINEKEELEQYPDAGWNNKYRRAQDYFETHGHDVTHQPFLAVPLIIRDTCVGVLRVIATQNGEPFPASAIDFFRSFGRIIAKRLEIDTVVQEQRQSMDNLLRIGVNIGKGSNSGRQNAMLAIIEEGQKLMRASVCNLYLLDKYGETMRLTASTHPDIEQGRKRGKAVSYRRG